MSRMINSQTKRLNNSSFNVQRDLHYFQLVELGRLSASLIHEISTPLTAVSLTIEELHRERPDKLIRKARKDIKYLEEYVDAARQQLSGDSNKSSFSMTIAIHQVVMLLGSRAKTKNTKILIQTIGSIRLFGERVKFQQIIANLINNAIESYDDIYDRQKIVNVKVSIGKYNTVQITVSDQGKGISNKDKEKIFDLSSTQLSSLDKKCIANNSVDNAKGTALGIIVDGKGIGTDSTNLTIISQQKNHYIAYLKPQSSCANNSNAFVTQIGQLQLLKQSLDQYL